MGGTSECTARRSNADKDSPHVFGLTRIDRKSRLIQSSDKANILKFSGHGTESKATGMDDKICRKETKSLICPNVSAAAWALSLECRLFTKGINIINITKKRVNYNQNLIKGILKNKKSYDKKSFT